MYKQFGYSYYLKKKKRTFYKKLSFVSGLLLIIQMSFGSLFFVALPLASSQAATDKLCSTPVDVVVVMDRSGSMSYTSRCDWWQFKCVNSPQCTTYAWQQNTDYNQNQSWCVAKDQATPYNSVWTEYNPTKISAAKQAVNNFLGLMGIGDQSALVSFANSATLDKTLSNDHVQTQASVNGLIANGATDIGGAIDSGWQELKSGRANDQAAKIMILLTDGRANKPNGTGLGENAADVAYAINEATEAAGYGYKIFTIGLGSDGEINEAMLQNIASITGAQYYHAPTQNNLQAIYSSIASRICQLGSISGCKYADANKDGSISGEAKLAGWQIQLNNNTSQTQETDQNGCYQFSGLNPGTYTVSEISKGDTEFLQTYPASGAYSVNLAEGQNVANIDFGNYLPVCGNQFVDTDFSEVCELGQTQSCNINDLAGIKTCQSDCSGWSECIVQASCGNSVIDTNEQCDSGTANGQVCTAAYGQTCQYCSSACQLQTVTGSYCGDGIKNGDEQCDGQAGVGENQSCSDTCTLISLPYCGDGTCNNGETCSACSVDCGSCGGGGPVCGNGVIESGEQCDDGTSNGDCPAACSSVCQQNQCAPQAATISGYKYNDVNDNGVIDSGEQKLSNWTIQLVGCPYPATSSVSFLPNSNWNAISTGTEPITGQCTVMATTTTDSTGYYQFTGLTAGDYGVAEIAQSNWMQTYPASSTFYYFNLPSSAAKTDINFANYNSEAVVSLYCGDGTCNNNENCSACPADCGACSSGGSGGGGGGGGNSIFLSNTSHGYAATSTPISTPIVKGATAEPILKITKSIVLKNNFVNQGDANIEYSIIVTNAGNLTAYDVNLKDILPAGLEYSDYVGSNRSWDLGNIEPAKSKNVTYKVNIEKDAKPGIYKNEAEATAANFTTSVKASANLEVRSPAVLAATGFSMREFTGLVILLTSLLSAAFISKRKCLLNK